MLVTLLHLAREWIHGRYAHFRRFSWLTGVLALWLVFASGIGGFWLVWDRIAQYSLIATTEWLDALPVFGGALIRNFIASGAVNDRLFSLLIFLHIGIPLALLATMWVHLQRLSRPATQPAPDHRVERADRARRCCRSPGPSRAKRPPIWRSPPARWRSTGSTSACTRSPTRRRRSRCGSRVGGFTLALVALPWISRAARTPRPAAAVVDLANCNGCARCFADCPYAAVTMQPRSDGRPLPRQAVVDPDLCAGCGICAGACPSSTPFRSVAELATGIDMPQSPVDALRGELEAALARLGQLPPGPPTVVVFGCHAEHGGADLARLAVERTATVSMLCAAQLPPSFVEYALRAGADGVLVTGCRDGDCLYRLGNRWTAERLAALREPHLRAAVPRDRVRIAWVGRGGEDDLRAALTAFRADLAAGTPASGQPFAPPPKRAAHFR